MNNLKTGLLLTTLTVLFVALGSALAGRTGAMIAFGIAVAMNIGSYWFSDKLVLRMYKAREAGPEEAPELHALVADLAQRAAKIAAADIIVVSGGNTLFAVTRWRRLGVDVLLREAMERGAVLCGGSAGAIIWTSSPRSAK